MANEKQAKDILRVADLKTRYGDNWILNGINLTVQRGEIMGIVGGSGSGK